MQLCLASIYWNCCCFHHWNPRLLLIEPRYLSTSTFMLWIFHDCHMEPSLSGMIYLCCTSVFIVASCHNLYWQRLWELKSKPSVGISLKKVDVMKEKHAYLGKMRSYWLDMLESTCSVNIISHLTEKSLRLFEVY